jgi:hypothetical protein
MTANLFRGAVETAYNPSSLIVKAMEHILILTIIYIAVNVTEQVI